MPQCFQVLKCYKCLVFQVHQVKKSNKFECKLCGEKQSIKRHYGVGTGKECRLHVQKLNSIRGDIDELKTTLSSEDENFEEIENIKNNKQQVNVKKESKWSEYVEKPEKSTEESTNNYFFGNMEEVLDVPAKKRKFIRKNIRHKNKNKGSYKCDNEELSSEESIVKDPVTKDYPINISESSIKWESEVISESKNSVPKKFTLPICTKQYKWARFADENEQTQEDNNLSNNLERENFLTKNAHFKIKPAATNDKNYLQRNESTNQTYSKWDFHENTSKSNGSEFNIPVSSCNSKNQTQKLFFLCNDNELDDILNI